jgi:ferrous iron transport protein B
MDDVLILGNPNSGKSLLFNKLTGLRQKVANFPGVTVEIKKGQSDQFSFYDFPGIYTLAPLSQDETVAVNGFFDAVKNPKTKAVLCVLDGTRFERSLYLLLQLVEVSKNYNCSVVGVINIVDELISVGTGVRVQELERELGIRFFNVSAKKETGLSDLKSYLAALPDRVLNSTPVPASGLNSSVIETKQKARELARKFGPRTEILLKTQTSIDNFVLSSWFGAIIFAVLMLLVFQSIFTWSSPLMDFFETSIASLGDLVGAMLNEGWFKHFIREAIFGGVGSFLVFVPQIFVLFVFIGLLEDSGYLARASILLHRPLSFFGLSGRSFLPLLSGHACAIPAIMSARTIESPKKRFLTIIAAPFMSCSARLPVYGLLISGFIPAVTIFGGLLGLQGFVFFLLFFLGIVVGLLVTALLNKFSLKGQSWRESPFIVELPPYRIPSFRPIIRNAIGKAGDFVKTAGGVIFAVSVLVWVLGYFPNGQGGLETSYLSILGHWIEPLFAPMGLDWKIGVAIITSFLAREVFVGTLGTLYGIEGAEENMQPLNDQLVSAGVGIPGAAALLVFYSLAMQCVSTLAVVRRETGKNSVPVYMFLGMSLIAYLGAVLVYSVLNEVLRSAG